MAAGEPAAKKARMAVKDAANSFLDFVNITGSPYHSVDACTKMLRDNGFTELADGKHWTITRGGKYYVTKDGSEIMAFVVGGKFQTGKDSGFSVVGAHTDSPCLRVKPNSKMGSSGMLQVGIQCYGGGLWHTWFDRPLGVAGKVVVRQGDSIAERLVRIAKPLLLLPNLAIHLCSADEMRAFAPNKETHLEPVLCSKSFDDKHATDSGRVTENLEQVFSRHHAALLEVVAKELGCKPGDIVDMDLCLMDANPANLAGLYEEFISSPRIDNLLSTWAAVKGLVDYANSPAVANAQDVCVAVSFDHEEVGSQSATGAEGETLPAWLDRILVGLDVSEKERPLIMAKSFLLSADCAHGVHPNYAGKHQNEHRPEFHKGIVIKINANQRYATTAFTSALFREIARVSSVPVQEFAVRNDSPCGTTIGPICSAKLGIRTIDIGAPQWGMHSCRETCATSDAAHLLALCESFFMNFRELDSKAAQV